MEKQPDRIDEWVQWSEDQRISEGWFLRVENNKWNLGEFFRKDGYKETLTEYPKLKSACAAFIKLQLEDTREIAEVNSKKKIQKR